MLFVLSRVDLQEEEGACSLLLLLKGDPGLKGTNEFQDDRFQLNTRKKKPTRTIMNYLVKKRKTQKSFCMFKRCTRPALGVIEALPDQSELEWKVLPVPFTS